jgi:hypothetical protein
MAVEIQIGDRVRVHLDSANWASQGWHDGTVVRIDPYSRHRRFYWVALDVEVSSRTGGKTGLLSVFNPKYIEKINSKGV